MDSRKHYQDQQSDTGIGLTPDEFLIKPSNLGDSHAKYNIERKRRLNRNRG